VRSGGLVAPAVAGLSEDAGEFANLGDDDDDEEGRWSEGKAALRIEINERKSWEVPLESWESQKAVEWKAVCE
jgi:hypothetical protein